MTGLLAVQVATTAACLGLIVIAPPSRGAMMLIPISATRPDPVARLAIEGGAQLVGTGPVRGSMVVYGDRAVLAPMMLKAGILVTAAPAAACGARS